MIDEEVYSGWLENTSARHFKVGDVLRHTPLYLEHRSKDWGLGIVVRADGPIFEAFWVGDDKFRKGDARLVSSYILQNVGPLVETAENINKMRPKKP